MSDTTPDKPTRDRSPSFPFIPLQTAVERLVAFDKAFGRHPVPIEKAGSAWGMKEKSSQADQTLAALRSFGLIGYQKVNGRRVASLTEEARTFVRAQQDSVKKQVLKQSALRPKIIRKFWATWGPDRPTDTIALDQLVLDNSFSDAGARNFLKVYDSTIRFAELTSSDKVDFITDNAEDEADEVVDEQVQPNGSGQIKPPRPPKEGQKLMEGERILTTGMLSKEASFRLLVSGNIGVKEMELLLKKLEIDKEILAEPDQESDFME